MDAKEFFCAVAKMRKYQKQYEKSLGRDNYAKRLAKETEQAVDYEISRVAQIKAMRDQLKLDM